MPMQSYLKICWWEAALMENPAHHDKNCCGSKLTSKVCQLDVVLKLSLFPWLPMTEQTRFPVLIWEKLKGSWNGCKPGPKLPVRKPRPQTPRASKIPNAQADVKIELHKSRSMVCKLRRPNALKKKEK